MNRTTRTTYRDTARNDRISQRVASILAIPLAELPDADARATLVRLAESGAEVYAYRPACGTTHLIWQRPKNSRQDGRHKPATWAACWRAVRESRQRQARRRGIAPAAN